MSSHKISFSNLILLIVIVLPYIGVFAVYEWYQHKVKEISHASFIVVDKQEKTLKQFDYNGRELCSYPIACGKNIGNKMNKGDMRTPEGLFHISDISESKHWKHDFNDGKGSISGAYGPYFIRLDVPGFHGIGIHGTHDPSSIGTNATEGCIRLSNQNIVDLVNKVHVGMLVMIL